MKMSSDVKSLCHKFKDIKSTSDIRHESLYVKFPSDSDIHINFTAFKCHCDSIGRDDPAANDLCCSGSHRRIP